MSKAKELHRYPLRVCKSLHHCTVCKKDIVSGQQYFDGGLNKRCHANCIIKVLTWVRFHLVPDGEHDGDFYRVLRIAFSDRGLRPLVYLDHRPGGVSIDHLSVYKEGN